jgi:MFS family permease
VKQHTPRCSPTSSTSCAAHPLADVQRSEGPGKAFSIFGSSAASAAAVGLVLGGLLTEYLFSRWCLYVNLFFAGFAAVGASALPPDAAAGLNAI